MDRARRRHLTWPRWLYKLNDPLDPWFGDDKASHWLGAGFGMCKSRDILAVWFGQGHLLPALAAWSWIAMTIVILLVEAVELYRWDRWQARGAPSPWPFLTDKVSLKDIAWGLFGAWVATQ